VTDWGCDVSAVLFASTDNGWPHSAHAVSLAHANHLSCTSDTVMCFWSRVCPQVLSVGNNYASTRPLPLPVVIEFSENTFNKYRNALLIYRCEITVHKLTKRKSVVAP